MTANLKRAAATIEPRTAIEAECADRRTVMQLTWSLVAGGAEMYALTVASKIDSRKYRSVLCAMDRGGALEPEIKRLGIPYFVMNRRPGIDFRLMWRLYRLFRETRVDVVHTHHFNQLFYGAIGARLAGARIIHTEHNVEYFGRKRLRVALRLLAALCDKVVAIGEDVERGFRERVGIAESKLQIVRAGVDTGGFVESRSDARRALGLSDSDRIAIIVARLYPEKNHCMLIRAFADVAREVARARLLIVGEGTERDAILEEAARLGLEGCIELLGVRRDIPRLLAASDVFVLSSEYEGLPIAALEAMAAARPVVATAVGDLPAVVRDKETGLLVAPGDCEGIAASLIELLNDPEKAEAMGAKARQCAEGYSLRAMIDTYEKLYAAR